MNIEVRPSGPPPGRIEGELAIGGRFRLVRLLGEGGMGVVWEAVDLASRQARAVKFLRANPYDAAAPRRFLREAESLRGVSHPNIVRILDIATDDDGTPAIVMELLRGESLASRLERLKTLPLGQTCAILVKVADAVRSAHASGIVHRDLKPDNIFLCFDEGAGTGVRVLDFGVAKKLEATPDKLTDTGTLVGTPHYMSPEQASGEKDLDGRTDAWAIGVIAFECLTGRMPVVGQNYGQLLMQLITGRVTKLGEVRRDLPAALVDVVDAALVPRDRRIEIGRLSAALSAHADPSIESPVADARAAVSSAETIAMAPSSSSRELDAASVVDVPPSPSMRTATRAIAAFAVVAVVTLGAGLFVSSRHRAPSEEPAASASASATDVEPSSSSSASVSVAESPSSALPIASPTAEPPTAAPASAAPPARPRTVPTATTRQPPTSTPTSTPASSGPGRLQGGVGSDVPF